MGKSCIETVRCEDINHSLIQIRESALISDIFPRVEDPDPMTFLLEVTDSGTQY